MSRNTKIATDSGIPFPLLLRPGITLNRSPFINPLAVVLRQTGAYRAWNSLDKIFSLESLLPRSSGLLINIGYGGSYGVVFRRVTARSYNHDNIRLIKHYKFVFEYQLPLCEATIGPSWVLDFTYSDAIRHESWVAKATDTVTVDGFIHESEIYDPWSDGNYVDYVCFATPKTLFCRGRCIDQIFLICVIPRFSSDEAGESYAKVVSTLYYLRLIVSLIWKIPAEK